MPVPVAISIALFLHQFFFFFIVFLRHFLLDHVQSYDLLEKNKFICFFTITYLVCTIIFLREKHSKARRVKALLDVPA